MRKHVEPFCIASHLAWSLALLGPGCATPPPSAVEISERITVEEDLRSPTPVTTLASLDAPDPAIRARAARALGRMRSSNFLQPLLDAVARERDPAVRAELAFAIGQIAALAARPALVRLLADPDPSVRAAAAEALGKLGDQAIASDVLPLLMDPDPAVRAAAARAQFRLSARRFNHPGTLDAAFVARRTELLGRLFSDPSSEVRFAAALALAEILEEEARPWLKGELHDSDEEVRRVCVWGLAHLNPDVETTAAIAERLWDECPRVIVEAARGLPPTASARARERLLALASGEHPSFHVRAAAADALGRMPPSPDVERALRAALRDASVAVRAAALVALVRVSQATALPEVQACAASPDLRFRQHAARAAVLLASPDGEAILDQLARDPERLVRAAALEALQDSSRSREAKAEVFRHALLEEDVAIRTTAAQGLEKTGTDRDGAALVGLWAGAAGPDQLELRLALLSAVAALLGPRAIPTLQAGLEDPDLAVRVDAAKRLSTLTGTRVEPSIPSVTRSLEVHAGQDFLLPDPNPVVYLKTPKGLIGLELWREDAPTHVKSFLDLTQSGRYDGLTFHRVESNWVAQGLDPRGDGWGTGGRQLRDEINPRSFLRGVVGMPNAGPDNGGCQIFIMLVHAPRLDGRYTAFGRVVTGMDVVDALEVGDQVTWVKPSAYVLENPAEVRSSGNASVLPTEEAQRVK
jgi:peptidylprolyl isomerase